MKCFYHVDGDGRCAGFWVDILADKGDGKCEFIMIDYNIRFPIETIQSGETVYIVDFSIKPNEMRKLLQITPNVTWIDHHKTAIELYKDFETPIRGVRYDGVAGCMLTYCYLQHMTNMGSGDIKPFKLSMTEDAPMFTKLIADYDVWTFKYGDDTRNFQTAITAYDLLPDDNLWRSMILNKFEKGIIDDGMSMRKYRDTWAKTYCNQIGYEIDFEGYHCYAMNLGLCNSDYFKSIDSDKYDIYIAYSFNGKFWKVSLYSSKVDVSEIAKKYGGGGHRGASGFTTKIFLFRKKWVLKCLVHVYHAMTVGLFTLKKIVKNATTVKR